MRYERLGKLSFESEHVGGLVDVFLATAIAPDSEGDLDGRARSDRVGLGERDFMSIDKISGNVIDVIFADHDPAVGIIFPHVFSPEDTPDWLGISAMCIHSSAFDGKRQ